jgi:hypothetical protein
MLAKSVVNDQPVSDSVVELLVGAPAERREELLCSKTVDPSQMSNFQRQMFRRDPTSKQRV